MLGFQKFIDNILFDGELSFIILAKNYCERLKYNQLENF